MHGKCQIYIVNKWLYFNGLISKEALVCATLCSILHNWENIWKRLWGLSPAYTGDLEGNIVGPATIFGQLHQSPTSLPGRLFREYIF